MPEGSSINEFNTTELSNSKLVFIGEMEFDGLFGYETISTRLIKKFGRGSICFQHMLKEKDNFPASGQHTDSFEEAKNFSNNFEIQGIEIVANSKGIVDFSIGHPSETLSLTKTLESFAIQDIGKQKSMIISTGKDSSNDTLSKSLIFSLELLKCHTKWMASLY